VYTFFWQPLYIYMYRGCQKMYKHFKRCYLCKMCIHFWHPLYIYTYIYMYRGCQKVYTHQRVPKKCTHILRDIYVKCVYIFWHPLYIYIYKICPPRQTLDQRHWFRNATSCPVMTRPVDDR